jgi:hypothetical protein
MFENLGPEQLEEAFCGLLLLTNNILQCELYKIMDRNVTFIRCYQFIPLRLNKFFASS